MIMAVTFISSNRANLSPYNANLSKKIRANISFQNLPLEVLEDKIKP
jgi:hypothetical protein